MAFIRAAVLEEDLKSKLVMKAQADKKATPIRLEVGDLVVLDYPRPNKRDEFPKAPFVGPYRVENIDDLPNVTLSDPSGSRDQFNVHVIRLKLFKRGTEPITIKDIQEKELESDQPFPVTTDTGNLLENEEDTQEPQMDHIDPPQDLNEEMESEAPARAGLRKEIHRRIKTLIMNPPEVVRLIPGTKDPEQSSLKQQEENDQAMDLDSLTNGIALTPRRSSRRPAGIPVRYLD
jgi:hypothetical protein